MGENAITEQEMLDGYAAGERVGVHFATALLAVQQELPKLEKTGDNPHYGSKFIKLDTIMAEIRPVLSRHGLVWITRPCRDERGEPALSYRLVHAESGEFDGGTMPLMLAKSDPQSQGSAITYARRYSITAMLGLVADEDDDGHAATARAQATNGGERAQPVARPVEQTARAASAKQRGLINAKAAEANMPASVLAAIVLVANGAEPREFASEDAAQEWLKRGLDRLPASKVDAVLDGIKAEVAA